MAPLRQTKEQVVRKAVLGPLPEGESRMGLDPRDQKADFPGQKTYQT